MDEKQPEAKHVDAVDSSAVDQALGALVELEQLPVNEHVAVFEEIHTTLRTALSRPAGG